VLRAYFDESGIHATSKTTIICGFIGPRSDWRRVARKWQKTTKGEIFHYKNMRNETQLIEKLATILGESCLAPIAMGFLGDWDRVILSGEPHWPTRFPSCYQLVLEMCVQNLERHSQEMYEGEPIVLTFSRQDQYAKFAEEIWRAYRDAGLWNYVVGFGYGDPELPELQTADMIAYEAFQCAREVYERGQLASPLVWENWPLIKKLQASKKKLLGKMMDEERLLEMLREGDKKRKYVTVPKRELKRS
jgi:hypothetical protein